MIFHLFFDLFGIYLINVYLSFFVLSQNTTLHLCYAKYRALKLELMINRCYIDSIKRKSKGEHK